MIAKKSVRRVEGVDIGRRNKSLRKEEGERERGGDFRLESR